MPNLEKERERQRKKSAASAATERNLPEASIKDPIRRESCRLDDCLWLKTYLPHVFYYQFTADQQTIILEIGQTLRHGSSKCIAAPRGDGKTSIAKYLTLKYALYGEIRFGLILCATGPKADRALGDIKKHLRSQRGTPLHDDFERECSLARYVGPAPARANNATMGGRAVHLDWKQDRIILPTFPEDEPMGPIIMSLGVQSDQLQGCNVYDVRPDFVMLDDLDSRESLAAVDGTVAGKVESIIDQNVGGLGGPGRRMGQVMLCTITSRDSVAYKYSDPQQKPAWSGIRMARIRKWPTKRELWDEYVELRQRGQNTRVNPADPASQPIDPFGRAAHNFYLAHRAEMDDGAELSNQHDFNADILPDGSPTHASALQKCFDYIADKGLKSFLTEHQNDPPLEEGIERTKLTAYHVQHNCRSGLDQKIVPAEAVAVVRGLDIKKAGFHYVAWAFDKEARGCCIEYNFFELMTERMEMKSVELAILAGLHEWSEAADAEPYIDTAGNERRADLTLIDAGWKDETWMGQPVDRFCAEAGFGRFKPCKGESPYHRPKPTPEMLRKTIIGDNWHVTFDGGIQLVHTSSDHWKQTVHQGFLSPLTEPGSLCLHNPTKKPPHHSFAHHITAEVWERRFKPGFGGWREGWWKVGGQNHFFDAAYMGVVARSMLGVSVLSGQAAPAPKQPAPPVASEGPSRRRVNFRR